MTRLAYLLLASCLAATSAVRAEPPDPASLWMGHYGLNPPRAESESYWMSENFRRWLAPQDPDSPNRHRGLGQPLEGTSWRNRPIHADWFVGWLWGDQLIGGRVGQGENLFGGYRIGYDFGHYWGAELRAGFAYPEVHAGSLASTNSRDVFWDAHALFYPWGDARWRPYASLGLGAAGFHFVDDQGRSVDQYLVHMPLGIGVKYQWKRWLALRADLMDNLAIGSSGLNTMNNFSATVGVEVHCGLRRVKYLY